MSTKVNDLALIHKRQLELEELNLNIEQTDSQETVFELLKHSHQLSLLQTKELIHYTMEKSSQYLQVSRNYEKAVIENQEVLEELKREKAHNNEMFDNICVGMLNEPKETFEIMLRNIERDKKIADTSGNSWQWFYKFNFIARLRMAFKLLI